MKRLLILALFLTGCSAKPAADDAKPTALVTTARAEQGAVEETLTAYGAAEILPFGERSLTAPVEAVIASVAAPVGTQVRAGQPVVILTPSPATRLEADKARHDAEVADAAYARAKRLRLSGLNSDADVETARAAAQTAQAAAQSLGARTSAGLTLRAPMSGVVETLTLAPGDLAAAGASIAKVGDPTALRARLGVEPASAAAIHAGATVRLTPAAGGPGTTGQVVAVDPRADPQTRLASVSVRLRSAANLSPGEPVRGEIVLRQHGAGVLISRAAVLYDQDKPYVFVAAGAVAHRTDITLGADQGDRVEVTKGLAAGTSIVVEGAAALEDGMAIREAPPPGARGDPAP